MLPVLSRIALQSLAGFCLIKHRTSSTFLQQTSYIYCSCQLVLGVTSTWKLTNRRWISEQACLDWASPTILYSLSSSGHFIIASPMDPEGLTEVITLTSTSFLSQICLGFPCWALLASEWQWNELLSYPLLPLCCYSHTLQMSFDTLLQSTSQCQKISICCMGGRIC